MGPVSKILNHGPLDRSHAPVQQKKRSPWGKGGKQEGRGRSYERTGKPTMGVCNKLPDKKDNGKKRKEKTKKPKSPSRKCPGLKLGKEQNIKSSTLVEKGRGKSHPGN